MAGSLLYFLTCSKLWPRARHNLLVTTHTLEKEGETETQIDTEHRHRETENVEPRVEPLTRWFLLRVKGSANYSV